MDELAQLRYYLEHDQVGQALVLLDEMDETLDEVFDLALRGASREVYEGVYSPGELAGRFDRDAIIRDALVQIRQEQSESRKGST